MFFVRQLQEIKFAIKLSRIKMQNFQTCCQPLSGKVLRSFKTSPVTLRYSPATAILNETPASPHPLKGQIGEWLQANLPAYTNTVNLLVSPPPSQISPLPLISPPF